METNDAKIVLSTQQPTLEESLVQWRRAVSAYFRDCCVNCGGNEHVSVQMLVPLESGGRLTLANGTILCRTCLLGARILEKAKEERDFIKCPLNMFVSRKLYEDLMTIVSKEEGEPTSHFSSLASLGRFLMDLYLNNLSSFEDLGLWQDEGIDVKINFGVGHNLYNQFKKTSASEGFHIAEALRGLFLWYLSTVPQFDSKKEGQLK